MKLLLDMNLSPRLAPLLTCDDIEAVHWADIGAADAKDVEIMAYAKRENFVVLTYDLDFSAILAATQGEKPSVAQIRAGNLTPEAINKPVLSALRQMKKELEDGALLTIDLNRTRLRLLPLSPRK
jgi:predicted nuclease of predicted toxin-antitoxin system